MRPIALLAALAVAPMISACRPLDVTLDPPQRGFQLDSGEIPVPRGTETQRCYFVEVPSDAPVFVNRFEVAQNTGTHHTNVFRVETVKNLIGKPGDVVAEGECWNASNWSDWPLVMNSQESNQGAPNPDDPGRNGYSEWKLPDGVAHRFEPHELLMLQTHYVNATTQQTPLYGKVLINFHTIDPSGVTAEVGTLFASNQSIRVCPGDIGKYFESTCQLSSDTQPITLIAANSHFHSRGTYFSISVFDPVSGTSSAPFYESRSWADPPMETALSVPVPPGGGISYHCEYSVPESACGDPSNGCCYTFGGKVEAQEHCNVFVYYYPKLRDVGCF